MLSTNATWFDWQAGSRNRLLYTDGFDIHAYDPQTQADDTLTRVSDEITGLAWDRTGGAAVFAQDARLSAIELDVRDGRNVTPLAEGRGIRRVMTGENGKSAFFFGTVNKKEGVYKRQLER